MKSTKLHSIFLIWICLLALMVSLLGCTPTADLPDNDEENPIIVDSVDKLFDAITQGIVRSSPLLTYKLLEGDKEFLAQEIPAFFDNTKEYDKLREILEIIAAFDKSGLTHDQLLNLDIAQWYIKARLDSEGYVHNEILITHLAPTRLLRSHFFLGDFPTENRDDINLYLEILAQADSLLNQPIDALTERLNSGSIPPAFAIDAVISSESFKVPDISGKLSRVKSAIVDMPNVTEDKKQKLTAIVDNAATAYTDTFIELNNLLRTMRDQASVTGGLWTMPGGKEYYEYLLKYYCSADVTPEQVHNLGFQEVERIQAEIRSILDELGYEGVEASAALEQIERKNFITAKEVETECQRIIGDMKLQLPLMFESLPQTELKLEIKTDLPFRAFNAGNYVALNPDYYNTRHSLQAVLFHESMPGHQLQCALEGENQDISLFRNLGIISFPGYSEGWALYAERLALEYGCYYDKECELGYLMSDLLRAARLVVDTGLHYMEWTKEQAMAYMNETIGEPAEDEIERYIVMPGQACTYKIGEFKLLELREWAKAELQDKFDLKEFHNIILSNGSMPLDLLEKEVKHFIESKK